MTSEIIYRPVFMLQCETDLMTNSDGQIEIVQRDMEGGEQVVIIDPINVQRLCAKLCELAKEMASE